MGLLEGKTALITGGSARIGLASAVRLAAEGAHVFITGRRKTELGAAVEVIGSAATAVTGDISNLADLDRLYETIRSRGWPGRPVRECLRRLARATGADHRGSLRHPLRHQRPGHAAWANELKGRGIRVDTITPGPTDTPALSGLTPDPERFKQLLATRVPMGRIGCPEEIAAAVTFLASEQSSFITGSSLYVDGSLNQI